MEIKRTKENDLYEKMVLYTQLAFEAKNLEDYRKYLGLIISSANELLHSETLEMNRFIQAFRYDMNVLYLKYPDFL